MLSIEKSNITIIDVYQCVTSYLYKKFYGNYHVCKDITDELITDFLDQHITSNNLEITITDCVNGCSIIFLSYPGSNMSYIVRSTYNHNCITISINKKSPRAYTRLSDM
jgi:hypothetical protein